MPAAELPEGVAEDLAPELPPTISRPESGLGSLLAETLRIYFSRFWQYLALSALSIVPAV